MKVDKQKNSRMAQSEDGNLLRELLNQMVSPSLTYTQLFLKVRCYKVSIPNKPSGEHDFHAVSRMGLLKSYVPLPVY